MKRCTLCKQCKPCDEFWQNRDSGDGRHWWCHSCAREKYNGYRKQTDTRTKRDWHLKSKYGIDIVQYEAMLVAQDDACAVCRRPFSGRVHVDHDHATGAVRGLLCHGCNIGLGYYEKKAAAFAAYLEGSHRGM